MKNTRLVCFNVHDYWYYGVAVGWRILGPVGSAQSRERVWRIRVPYRIAASQNVSFHELCKDVCGKRGELMSTFFVLVVTAGMGRHYFLFHGLGLHGKYQDLSVLVCLAV
jgi:hypothetical protein